MLIITTNTHMIGDQLHL